MTLIGAAVAGLLVYLAVEIVLDGEENETLGEYWSSVGLVALAGLVMALSQLLGGWTKWGWPRLSGPVFVLGFLPVLIVVGWLVLGAQPEGEGAWLRGDISNRSDDIGIETFVERMEVVLPLLVFGTGLVFGFSFDTTGPRVRKPETVITAPPARDQTVEREDDKVIGAGAKPEAPPQTRE